MKEKLYQSKMKYKIPFSILFRSIFCFSMITFFLVKVDGQSGVWLVSYSGTDRWQLINTGREKVPTLRFGDFDGDKKTDIFYRPKDNRDWLVSYGATGRWEKINESKAEILEMAFGDFNGDGKTDVFHRPADSRDWLISYGGTSRFEKIGEAKAKISEIAIGDFNGDGKADIFQRPTDNRDWLVSYSATGRWEKINESKAEISEMVFGDFNGDGKTDIFHRPTPCTDNEKEQLITLLERSGLPSEDLKNLKEKINNVSCSSSGGWLSDIGNILQSIYTKGKAVTKTTGKILLCANLATLVTVGCGAKYAACLYTCVEADCDACFLLLAEVILNDCQKSFEAWKEACLD